MTERERAMTKLKGFKHFEAKKRDFKHSISTLKIRSFSWPEKGPVPFIRHISILRSKKSSSLKFSSSFKKFIFKSYKSSLPSNLLSTKNNRVEKLSFSSLFQSSLFKETFPSRVNNFNYLFAFFVHLLNQDE